MLTETPGGVRLAVHVQPGAKRNAVLGTHGDALKIAIAAPPVEGKANRAAAEFIAVTLAVPIRDVTLHTGQTSRRKTFEISGLGLADANDRLLVALAARK